MTYSSKIEGLIGELYRTDTELATREVNKIAWGFQHENDDMIGWIITQIPKLSHTGNYYYGFLDGECMFLFEGKYDDICKKLKEAIKRMKDELFCPECGCERDQCECNANDDECSHDGCNALWKYCSQCGEKL